MTRTRRSRGASSLLAVSIVLGALACRGAPTSTPVVLAKLEPPRVPAARFESIDVEHYALDLTLHPRERSFDGLCRVRFVAREPVDRIELDLEGLQVRSVTGADGGELAFSHERGRLAIDLGRRLARGGATEVVVHYGGAPAKGLWFAAEQDGSPTQVFTQGECEDARWWFPCLDYPSERATSELRVTMPVSWRALAAGTRLERCENGSTATELWRMQTPHPSYLVTLVAGEFVEQRGSWEGVPLVNLAASRHAPYMDDAFARTGEILAFLSEVTGVRYPYAKYGQACVENFPFGGMENISATTLTETTLKDERGRRDGTSEGLVAHEAAHQWFGDLLTCEQWSQIWLNEGFATYMTALWFERSEGVESLHRRMRTIQESYVERDVGAARRPMVWDEYRAPMDLFMTGHAYQGGAARLHLLRFVVGERAFFRGLQLYVGGNVGRSVTTDDVRAALEEASGDDLGWFFEQWFERPGYPEFEVRWRYDVNRKRIHVAVDQVQEIADGTPEAFRTPVDIEVRTASGRRRHRFEIDRRRRIFDIPSDEAPLWVRFDKYGWIPKTVNARKDADEWLLIAAEDDDVNGRHDAVLALGRLAAEEGSDTEERGRLVAALRARLATDTAGTVRAAAAEGLGKLREQAVWRVRAELAEAEREEAVPGVQEIRSALELAAMEDEQGSVRVAALDALAREVDGPLADFAELVFEAGYSWNTMTAAARLLVAARLEAPEQARAWLESRMLLESPHDTLRAGLVGVYVGLEDLATLERLRGIARDASESSAVRAAAAKGMGTLARGELGLAPQAQARLRVDVTRELAELLKERGYRLRGAALDALAAFEDPAIRPILLAYYERTVFPRERRKIERGLSGLRVQ